MINELNTCKLSPTEEALDNLRLWSAATFYLTGSRAFGYSNDYSDWDFYTQDTLGTRVWLGDHGYQPLGAYEYTFEGNDPNTAKVYRLNVEDTHIDIQLQRDVGLKHKVQAALIKSGLLRWLSKVHHKKAWALGYELLWQGRKL